MIRILCGVLAALAIVACKPASVPKEGTADPAAASAARKGAPLFDNLGTFTRPVTIQSDEARRYFNQGLVLTYGFNHAEAGRSFREAARLDPKCAMCWWGAAIVMGPNINLPMADTEVPEAFATSRKALAQLDDETPVERALVNALQVRYAEQPVKDRAPLDLAYANAMRDVARQFPEDADVQALFAESLLDLSPWNYHETDGKPKPTTVEAVAALDKSKTLNPNHPGALHYYIHAVEKSDPQSAVDEADRLWHLAPGAGHLVHMPAHIYLRVGRYHDAVVSNLEASSADKSYIAQCQVQGFYPLAYYPHNWHFVWVGSILEGNRKQALEGASQTHHVMHGAPVDDPAFGSVLQHMMLSPVFAAVRLAEWDAIDKMAKPDAKHIYPTAIWHHARGMAFSARGDLKAAESELAEVKRILANPELAKLYVSTPNTADKVVAISASMLAGDIAARRKDYPAAITALEEAVRVEDSLGYTEPEDWQYPARLLLGTVLLEARRAVAAEAAFRGDLDKHPENGWALFGLEQALRAQNKTKAADEARKRFDTAWKYADVKLTAAVIR
jgi:tetratricopeptide (TPR) repeat protein